MGGYKYVSIKQYASKRDIHSVGSTFSVRVNLSTFFSSEEFSWIDEHLHMLHEVCLHKCMTYIMLKTVFELLLRKVKIQ